MTATFCLVRHGLPDWERIVRLEWIGPAADLAPLTAVGIAQAEQAAEDLRNFGASRIVASPMTRALQTAGIISARTGLQLSVELELHEWFPHKRLQWAGVEEVRLAYDDMVAAGLDGRPREPFMWESLGEVRARTLRALKRYAVEGARVIAVCHEVVIYSLTGHQKTPHATGRILELET
jgi:broad specificity phosphatase PhoE